VTGSIPSELPLQRSEGEWFVDWTPSVVHPALVAGGRFERTRQWLPRAPVLSVHGEPLVGSTDIVVVGVEPGRLSDRAQAVRALVEAAGASEDAVNALLDRPDLRGDWFYPVVELSREAFATADPVLRPVPGILFREAEGRAGPTVAPHIVGRTGPVTQEQLAELGAPYLDGDVVGQSGLERALESRLAGSPATEVRVLDDAGEVIEVVHRVEAVEPQPVRTTLDPAMQRAAEQALEGAPSPAALVAVDIATGGLRAVANAPARASTARWPAATPRGPPSRW
jgi:cell division protein FtsI/penicillin-binding protein 2